MNDRLTTICNNIITNFNNASGQYMLDYKHSHVTYGICLTDYVAPQEKIDEAKQIIKSNTGMFSTMGNSCPRMVSIAKMVKTADPEGTYRKFTEGKDAFKGVFMEDTYVTLAAILLTDCFGDLSAVAQKTQDIYKVMKKKHFLGLDSKDKMTIALMAVSGKKVEDMMSEADAIYAAIKKSFTFAKDDAYTVAYLLSASGEPAEWKIKTALALIADLKASKIKFSGYTTASIIAPLTVAALTTDRTLLINEIKEADRLFSAQKGMGGMFGISTSIRNMLAAASVIKAYAGEDQMLCLAAEYLTVMACEREIKSEQDSAATT